MKSLTTLAAALAIAATAPARADDAAVLLLHPDKLRASLTDKRRTDAQRTAINEALNGKRVEWAIIVSNATDGMIYDQVWGGWVRDQSVKITCNAPNGQIDLAKISVGDRFVCKGKYIGYIRGYDFLQAFAD